MKPSAWLVITCVLGGGCVHDALLSITPGVDEFPGTPSHISPISPLGREIESGYQTYGVALAADGQWSVDPTYGVRWCPKANVVPYASHGHWAPVESVTTPHGAFPPDAPYWVADPDVARGDVTLHHGWWVGDERPGGRDRWCWIPGVEEVTARVVWREGDGYVAWAPEPPPDSSEDEDDDELLTWFYEFTGTLFEDVIDDYLLRGDDAEIAEAVTRWTRSRERSAGTPPHVVGPSAKVVASARSSLSEYTVAHPSVGAPTHAGGPSMHGSLPLPKASLMFRQMSNDPTLVEGPTSHPLPPVSRDAVHAWGAHGGGFNSYAGHAGAGQGCSCASNSGHGGGGDSRSSESHASSSHGSEGHASESHSSGGGGSSHNSYAGHAGGSGGDCGSHSSVHK